MPPYQIVMPTSGPATPSSNDPHHDRRSFMNQKGSHKADGAGSKTRISMASSGRIHRDASQDNLTHPTSTITGGGHAAQHTPHLLLENPMDGPLKRMKNEWKDPWSWFGIDDCGRLLDVPNSFGGTQTVYKWVIWLWILASLCYIWSTLANDVGAWFMGNLDHWALLLSLIYCTMSLANGHFRPPQPAVASEGVNTYVKCFWVIFELAAHLELLTAFLFWTVVFHKQSEGYQMDYGTFMLHGLVTIVVWFDGMVLNRIPVRIKHYFIVLAVDAVYVVWTVIHAAAGWGNGKPQPATVASQAGQAIPGQTDAIYVALDWNDELVQTIFVSVLILTVIAPALFLIQYMMSLYSFPWTWNGSKSRKCIEFDMSTSVNPHGRGVHHGPQYTRRRGSNGATPPSPTRKMSTKGLSNNSDGNNPQGSSHQNKTSINSDTSRTSSRLGLNNNNSGNNGNHANNNRPMSPRPTSPRPTSPRPTSPRPTSPRPPSPRRTSQRPTSPHPSSSRPTSPRPSVNESNRRSATPVLNLTDNTSVLTGPPPDPKRKKKRKPSTKPRASTNTNSGDDKRKGRPVPKRDLSRMDIA